MKKRKVRRLRGRTAEYVAKEWTCLNAQKELMTKMTLTWATWKMMDKPTTQEMIGNIMPSPKRKSINLKCWKTVKDTPPWPEQPHPPAPTRHNKTLMENQTNQESEEVHQSRNEHEPKPKSKNWTNEWRTKSNQVAANSLKTHPIGVYQPNSPETDHLSNKNKQKGKPMKEYKWNRPNGNGPRWYWIWR